MDFLKGFLTIVTKLIPFIPTYYPKAKHLVDALEEVDRLKPIPDIKLPVDKKQKSRA